MTCETTFFVSSPRASVAVQCPCRCFESNFVQCHCTAIRRGFIASQTKLKRDEMKPFSAEMCYSIVSLEDEAHKGSRFFFVLELHRHLLLHHSFVLLFSRLIVKIVQSLMLLLYSELKIAKRFANELDKNKIGKRFSARRRMRWLMRLQKPTRQFSRFLLREIKS